MQILRFHYKQGGPKPITLNLTSILDVLMFRKIIIDQSILMGLLVLLAFYSNTVDFKSF